MTGGSWYDWYVACLNEPSKGYWTLDRSYSHAMFRSMHLIRLYDHKLSCLHKVLVTGKVNSSVLIIIKQ